MGVRTRPWEIQLGCRRAVLTGQDAASSQTSCPLWPSALWLPPPPIAWEPRRTEKGRCFTFAHAPFCALQLWEGREVSFPFFCQHLAAGHPPCRGHSPTDVWVREDMLGRGPPRTSPCYVTHV